MADTNAGGGSPAGDSGAAKRDGGGDGAAGGTTTPGAPASVATAARVLAEGNAEFVGDLRTLLEDYAHPLWKMQMSGFFEGLDTLVACREALGRKVGALVAATQGEGGGGGMGAAGGDAGDASDGDASAGDAGTALQAVLDYAPTVARQSAAFLLGVPRALHRSSELSGNSVFQGYLRERGCSLEHFQGKLLVPAGRTTQLRDLLALAVSRGGSSGGGHGNGVELRVSAGSSGTTATARELEHMSGAATSVATLLRLQHRSTWKARKAGSPKPPRPATVAIVAPDRMLERQGALTKRGKGGEVAMQAWLCNNIFLYGTQAAGAKKAVTLHEGLPTRGCVAEAVAGSDTGFTVAFGETKTCAFDAPSAADRDAWVAAFKACAASPSRPWVPEVYGAASPVGKAAVTASTMPPPPPRPLDGSPDADSSKEAGAGGGSGDGGSAAAAAGGAAAAGAAAGAGAEAGAGAGAGSGAGAGDGAATPAAEVSSGGGGGDEIEEDGIVFGTVARGWRGDRHPVIARARVDKLVENILAPHADISPDETRRAFFLTHPFWSTPLEVTHAFEAAVARLEADGSSGVRASLGGSTGLAHSERSALVAALEALVEWMECPFAGEDLASDPGVAAGIRRIADKGATSALGKANILSRQLVQGLKVASGARAAGGSADAGAGDGDGGSKGTKGSGLLSKFTGMFGSKRAKKEPPVPSAASGKRKSLRDYPHVSAEALAVELLWFDVDTRAKIEPRELLHFDGLGAGKDMSQCPHVKPILDNFDKLSYWVAEEVLYLEFNARQRAEMLEKWVETAHVSLELHNFNAVFAIVNSLKAYYVQRLETAWSMLSKVVMDKFRALDELVGNASNYRAYRKACSRADRTPYLDSVTVSLKDLATGKISCKSETTTLKGNKATGGPTVAFGKWTQLALVVDEVLRTHQTRVPFKQGSDSGLSVALGPRNDKVRLLIRHGFAVDLTTDDLNRMSQEANLRENQALEESLEEAGFF